MIDEPNFDDLENDVTTTRGATLVLHSVLDDALLTSFKGPFSAPEANSLTPAEMDLLALARTGYAIFALTKDQWTCVHHAMGELLDKVNELREKYYACRDETEEDTPGEGSGTVRLN